MHTVKVNDLTEGMIVAQNVLSRMGQIIVYKNSCLTKQMISQICYYQIPSVEIIDGEIPPQTALALEHKHEVEKTYLQRVLSRPDFEKFKERYISAIALMENSLNDIIFRRIEIDEPDLIEDTVNLFNRFDSTYELFAIIHELQKIDSSTQAHSMNVAIISRLIGTWAGMDKADLDNVTLAGLIHDIGKIKIPDIILLKPGKLTTSEYDFVKKHTIFGFEAIKDQRIDKRIKDAVLLHHERYDGSAAFILSELRTAFILGFLIYIPFIVIDMVVSSVLMSMGMMMLPPTTISLPFKVLLFILADGWDLVIGNLVKTFY